VVEASRQRGAKKLGGHFVQKLMNLNPERVRKVSLAAGDNTLSEFEKITAHLIMNLNILIHLQILAAAVAELERGPSGGDIILIHATDLMILTH